VGPLLFNPIDRFLNEGNPQARKEKRIDVLSAWREYSLRCAEIFSQVRV
jgi:hypothetical protein